MKWDAQSWTLTVFTPWRNWLSPLAWSRFVSLSLAPMWTSRGRVQRNTPA